MSSDYLVPDSAGALNVLLGRDSNYLVLETLHVECLRPRLTVRPTKYRTHVTFNAMKTICHVRAE